MRTPRLLVSLLLLSLSAPAGAETASSSAPIELRIATLAPAGSAWAKIMEEGAARLDADTHGRVKIRYYFGGLQGDERDVVRKMKLDQLDGAALTAIGLGLIQPDVLVLQLPYLVSSDKQIDYVRDKLGPEFEKEFDRAGYILVAWGDVGWVHSYFAVEVKSATDFGAVKFWQWVDDPITREMFAVLDVNGVPLNVPDVLPALQTGSIQACSAPPLAAVALQWYTKLKYMADRPTAYAIGALVIKKSAFLKIQPADREVLLRDGREIGLKLTASVRRDNERAKQAMLRSGVQLIHVPDDAQARLVAAGKQVWTRLAGKLYSKQLLDRVLQTVAQAPER
jgi:TRAP-type transport system periplasmic protein